MNTKEFVFPEGWEIDKIENNKIILKESKKELPKTWEECASILSRRVCERIDDIGAKPTESKSIQLSDVKAKIDAWMARDKNGDLVCCAGSKPFKEEKLPFWRADTRNFIECVPNDLFPDLTWNSEPLEVELIIKRKKK